MSIGKIYLPGGIGTPVGSYEFILNDKSSLVEIGTVVTAETKEGLVVGMVDDMRTIGLDSDPILANLANGTSSTKLKEVILGKVTIFYSKNLRSVKSGTVRIATHEEIKLATGFSKNNWPIAGGVIPLDNQFSTVYLDGTALLGPESAHLNVGGLSGQAAKTSYMSFLLKSALNSSGPEHKIAALLFNVKGDDLIYLDQPASNKLSDEDIAMYQALGLTPEPFQNVTVFAPATFMNKDVTNSSRIDSHPLLWDLKVIWPYLKSYLGNIIYEDEKIASFLADFATHILYNKNPNVRIGSFEELDYWFRELLAQAEESETQYAWRSHHKATMWRIRRMLMGIVSRSNGLISMQSGNVRDVNPNLYQDGAVVVIDISSLTPDIQAVVMTKVIQDALKNISSNKLNVDHLIVLTDELNTFAPSSGTEMNSIKKLLHNISTQGRYAGVSLWGAGQKLSKIDEHIRDNAATRALGVISDGELSSGVYGKISRGLHERITSLDKGSIILSHYLFRSPLLIKFPRPAWLMGKVKDGSKNLSAFTSMVEQGEDQIDIALMQELATTSEDALELATKMYKVADLTTSKLVKEKSTFDENNPFSLS